ncbi:MAG TPA: HAD family phosphatase [Gammaproteobacteria bacterium]|nr:HAD family phosphatase [Gammaproteobacteria bacterium]
MSLRNSVVDNGTDLVIFDCDGVLVDSERIANRVFCEMLNELGLHVSLQDMFDRFVGLSMPQCVELIAEMHGEPPPPTFVAELRQRTAPALKAEIEPVRGVAEVLAKLRVPYCVASSGEHEKIRLTLGATGLLKYFEGRIFSVADVENPKPAPDVFLFAASQLGANPSACVVIEDTPVGVRAAVAAGMTALGFAANTPAHRLTSAGAHAVFSEMRQLTALLALQSRPALRSFPPAVVTPQR